MTPSAAPPAADDAGREAFRRSLRGDDGSMSSKNDEAAAKRPEKRCLPNNDIEDRPQEAAANNQRRMSIVESRAPDVWDGGPIATVATLVSLLAESRDCLLFFLQTVALFLVWSVLCAVFAAWLRERADVDPGGPADVWLQDIRDCKSAVGILGTLFVFSLVFRFNSCYDRWWESRVFWGDIITQCLEFAMMNRRYIGDAELADRMSRFIIAFPYALMALLRGSSLGEEGGHGVSLVQRGILTREELDHMHRHPCWQPHWILDVLRALVVEAHKVPGGKGIVVDEGNKIHGQFVRCFDNGLKRMGDLVGNCVRTGAGGLPVSYDAVVMISFFAFFLLASLVWSASIGWMTPFIVVPASAIIILLIVMGTKLVDPFGTDKVDVPMEAYCATVEAQVNAIDERAKDGTVLLFAMGRLGRPTLAGHRLRSSFSIPKLN